MFLWVLQSEGSFIPQALPAFTVPFPPPQPQNILLTSLSPPGDIKIVDFGLARRLGAVGELREILGTPEYVGKVALIKQRQRLRSGFTLCQTFHTYLHKPVIQRSYSNNVENVHAE